MTDAEAFRALARSSPWRWTTLRFTVRRPGHPWRTEPVRAWLRRPDRLRVETLDGELLQVVHEPRQRSALLGPDGGREVVHPWPADGPEPVLRDDGLVAVRPAGLSYDAPVYQSYDWVALLDPVELADGRDPDTGEPGGPGPEVDPVTRVEHGGRPAWEGIVRPTPRYEPRCACCSLLRSRDVDVRAGVVEELDRYSEAYRVRLDEQTGTCVWIDDPGSLGVDLDVRIEAVDEPIADALFG